MTERAVTTVPYLAECPFCGGQVKFVVDADDRNRYGIEHASPCGILPTIWAAHDVSLDTLAACWNRRYGVANMLRLKGADGLADEMAYLGRI